MVVASSRRALFASAAVASCWVDAALGSDVEGVGEDSTYCCSD